MSESSPPSLPRRGATALLRRLPPNASPEERERAYADALLFVLQTMPERLEGLAKGADEMKAIIAVADATSQRAANTAARLEGTQHELRVMQDTIRRNIETLQLELGQVRAEQHHLHVRQKSIPDLEHAVATTVDAARKLAEEVDEITDHGQHRGPSSRIVSVSERVEAVVKETLDDQELENWRTRKKWIADVAKAVAAAIAGAGLLELGHYIVAAHH